MAGHSKFKNIMYRKGAQDAKRAKKFTRLIKELAVAVRAGGDAESNPRLRSAMAACRAANMPKDNIDRVLKKGSGGDDKAYDEIRYEGYAPGGVAVIVEAVTDNRNRTASEIRATFSKFGGNLGESGSVHFMFERVGQIIYAAAAADDESMFTAAVEAGAKNVESDKDSHEITTEVTDFNKVRESLESAFGSPQEMGLAWQAQTTTAISEESAAQSFMRFMDALDDLDDVQSIASNVDIPDALMAKLA